MKYRQTPIEIFCTFIQWADGAPRSWSQPHPRLRRSVEKCLTQFSAPSISEDCFVRYWHTIWLKESNNLAKEHIWSYLQEPCYFAAQKSCNSYRNILSAYSIEDYFQVSIVKTFEKLTKSELNSANLKIFAKIAAQNVIIDEIRRLNKSFGHNNWSLLFHTSKKRLKTSLANYGFTLNIINSYLFAWDCFKEIYASTKSKDNIKSKEPDSQTWESIAQLYTSQRQSEDLECDATEIKQWLETCIKAIENYIDPQIDSFNKTLANSESGELQDIIADSKTTLLLDNLIEEEEKNKINSVLLDALQDLENKTEKQKSKKQTEKSQEIIAILPLFYGQELGQVEIAQQLSITQSKVSRRLSDVRETLLNSLVKLKGENSDISLNSDVINNISCFLDEWLYQHFAKLIENN